MTFVFILLSGVVLIALAILYLLLKATISIAFAMIVSPFISLGLIILFLAVWTDVDDPEDPDPDKE